MKTKTKQGYQVLVVDDEPSVRRAIKMLLNFDEHEVHAVDSGEAAMAVLEERKFDVVITDNHMPGMRGTQLAALIKEGRPNLPIIMVTAFPADAHVAGVPVAGLDFVLTKPFSQTELREAISKVLS